MPAPFPDSKKHSPTKPHLGRLPLTHPGIEFADWVALVLTPQLNFQDIKDRRLTPPVNTMKVTGAKPSHDKFLVEKATCCDPFSMHVPAGQLAD